MGRIDPAPPRPGRGHGSLAGWIVAGVLAVALAALVAFQAGKRSRTGTLTVREPSTSVTPSVQPPASTSAPAASTVDHVSSPSPPEQRLESAVMEVTIARPASDRERSSLPREEPPPAPPAPETLHDAMVRCLSLEVVDDLLHSTVPRETGTQVRISVRNSCSFSFAGPDVWYEIRAIPRSGGGTGARKVGRFSGGPIEARSRAELVDVLECPACYEESYRYEARLWWGSSDGRTE